MFVALSSDPRLRENCYRGLAGPSAPDSWMVGNSETDPLPFRCTSRISNCQRDLSASSVSGPAPLPLRWQTFPDRPRPEPSLFPPFATVPAHRVLEFRFSSAASVKPPLSAPTLASHPPATPWSHRSTP